MTRPAVYVDYDLAGRVKVHTQDTAVRPRIWDDVALDAIAQAFGNHPTTRSWKALLDTKGLWLSWSPSLLSCIAFALGRRSAYLCWGLPGPSSNSLSSRLKHSRLKCILNNASVLLANDPQTAADIRRMTGRKVIMFPFVVDTDFFSFDPSLRRSNYFLVPGNKSRNEHLVLALARAGLQMIRSTSEPAVRDFYGNHPQVKCHFRVTFPELRALYQSARAVLLPLEDPNHAAGQTALLEALACGAPVVISRGRAESVLPQTALITPCRTLDPEEWLAACHSLLTDANFRLDATPGVIDALAREHHPAEVTKRLVSLLRDLTCEATPA